MEFDWQESQDKKKHFYITRTRYLEATGHEPTHDDIERANCPRAGELGHFACGWNYAMNLPYTMVPRTPT